MGDVTERLSLDEQGNLDWTGGAEPSDPLRAGLLVPLASAAGTDAGNKRHRRKSCDAASGLRSACGRLVYIGAAVPV